MIMIMIMIFMIMECGWGVNGQIMLERQPCGCGCGVDCGEGCLQKFSMPVLLQWLLGEMIDDGIEWTYIMLIHIVSARWKNNLLLYTIYG
jgi:hypothetical protein